MGVKRVTGVCMFCGDAGIEKSCGKCNEGYHIACARDRGNLDVQEHGNGLVGSRRVNYDWECPNCGRSIRGEM